MMILTFFSIVNIVLLRRDYKIRQMSGYKFVQGDIKWNRSNIFIFGLLAIIGGFVTAAVGLSTEVLFTPFYIRMGVIPSVAGTTSQFLGIWATLSASAVFIVNGYMHIEFGFWLGFFSILATIYGSEAVGRFIGNSNRFSNAMWIIAFLVFVSLMAEGTVGITRIIDYRSQGKNMWELGDY
mmetsp:Transcript_18032/g.15958  ORF Transcript_18032/g.15958 Transcript_18032/m.15958 type:complete len:181 (+) Transcript_18032:1038-1580(+)